MPRSVQLPYKTTLVSSAARTATGTSASITLPVDLDGGAFILSCTAASGTSPTLDVEIQTSPDNGTTWFRTFQFAQVTAAAARRLSVTFRREAEAGAEASIASATSSALATNCAITELIRVRWQIAATTPSFTFAVFFIGQRQMAGSY